ncbi:MAG TPA: sorbosone dehydrogenase family protein [Chitinophagales bacterium]|nr:sorbosone dehydrogenase family protein [Chitinophagales bacterium]
MLQFQILCVCLISFLSLEGCFNKALKKTARPLPNEINLPQGFHISLFADNVENARSMTLGDKGTVFVGNRKGDKVIALVDADGNGEAEKQYVIAKGMDMPNGVAFYKGALYVAEVDKVWRFDNIEDNLTSPPKPVLVYDSLPTDKHHGWKYIAFGPDGKLYIPIGAPCNNCDDAKKDNRYASICRMNPDGTGFELFASGIRNTVGFSWHPQTGELWFTDNGRDMMGDSLPPDELNKAPQKGIHFGYPYCHGDNISDPDYGKEHACSEFTTPVATLGPHVAALGMKFYNGNMFPVEYRKSIFIAEHGSWNSTSPVGYRVTMVSFKKDGTPVYEPFAQGWLKDGKAWGRPVDILQLKDGSLLVSDDFANAVYRITYTK